jgi:hypothetical protein
MTRPLPTNRREVINMKRALATAAVACGLLAAPAPAPAAAPAAIADGSGPNQVVNVSNSVDATTNSRAGVQVGSTGAGSVGSTNLAVAKSTDCSGCQSLAAAFQAVFVTGEPTVFTPLNVATAANGGCTACGSFAFAYQYVLDTNGPVRLSAAARDQVDAIRAEADADLRQGLPYDQVDAEMRDLGARFRAIIDNETIRVGVTVMSRQTYELVDMA